MKSAELNCATYPIQLWFLSHSLVFFLSILPSSSMAMHKLHSYFMWHNMITCIKPILVISGLTRLYDGHDNDDDYYYYWTIEHGIQSA